MEFEGFIIHNNSCDKKKEEKWDFTIRRDGSVSASPEFMESDYIHICLEGDFNRDYELMDNEQKIQLFMASKIIYELSRRFSISPLFLFPHNETCPGTHFPWNVLVIYPAGGYH
ncbi:hypothetical protein [Paenibacillus dakarensis]|uniref:hypothetical protein n=1 Tax=Paenibacillus dakarensis TaxID=1527293 RepID=UPI0006D59F3D|nr:hypothetical protein [Paenibacillus dakarensis]